MSDSCISYLPVQQESLERYHKEPEELPLLQEEEGNKSNGQSDSGIIISPSLPFNLHEQSVICLLSTASGLIHGWKPTLTNSMTEGRGVVSTAHHIYHQLGPSLPRVLLKEDEKTV